ncbi:ABC-2 family transporter protein [Vagococcus elongatus]|uniref:ABC transporter permease n=1 Tax=Vagococcus elongatus TaxID=180344 RepID=A0A430AQT4_9ENTE|nr:ABC-2 family transporter protein [Vagococcus elongatus]RSU10491.1 hypothetical protein CBF29_09360 [Vagococcus elongatus]
MFKSFIITIKISYNQEFSGGLLPVFKKQLLNYIWFYFMCQIWLFIGQNSEMSLTTSQLLTYSLLSTVFRPQMDIITPATSSMWEGSIIGRYTRPMPIFSSFIAETIGKIWIPTFFTLSFPLIVLASIAGINPLPDSFYTGIMGMISLLLSVSLGFAMDFIFAALAMHLKDKCWAALQIRESLLNLLTGAVIPLNVMPLPVGNFLRLLPFASLASVPINIYMGIIKPANALLMQVVWNVLFWTIASIVYKKSEEEMISFGG